MEINKNNDILLACRFCPMCRHVCASGNISNSESDFSRGRAMLLYGVHKGSAQYDNSIVEALYNCFLCGCCWDHCESHYDLPKLLKASRIDMVDLGVAPREAYEIKESMLKYKNPYLIKDVESFDTKNRIKKGADYLYYMGFNIRYFNHEIAEAVSKLFDKIGLEYTFLSNEPDCGKVFSLLGFAKDSIEAAKTLYGEIKNSGVSKIIISDPLSYDCIKNDFKELGLNLEPGIEIMHFSYFFTKFMQNIKIKKYTQPVTLIDSEYLGRFNNIIESPRKILKLIADNHFIELMDNNEMQLASGEASFIFKNKKFGAAGILAKNICDIAKEKGLSRLITLSPTTKNYINKHTDCKAIDLAEFILENT